MADGRRAAHGAIEEEVRRRLSPERFRHVLGVVQTSLELADRFGIDREKARLAALLHDVAKEYPRNRLLKEALDFGIVLSEIELHATALIHAPVGAEVARREFGVDDPEVLAAIRYHTTGRAGMSPLEKLLFLADYIEPGRAFPGVDKVREAAQKGLDEAVLLALDQSLMYLITRGRLIHPDALAARNDVLRLRSEGRTVR